MKMGFFSLSFSDTHFTPLQFALPLLFGERRLRI